MNEERPSNQQGERDSQLSAMFDGELPAAECELLARRLVKDEALRAQWTRYSIIGAAVRAERGVALHDRVAWRVQSAIAQEATYGDSAAADAAASNAIRPAVSRSASASAANAGWMRFARPVFGAGIAAGVAALSILWLRTQDKPDGALLANDSAAAPAPTQVIAAPQPNANIVAVNAKPVSSRPAANREAGAYSTPAPSSQTNMAPPARLANYVVAHSEYSGPLSRRLALLSVVGNEGASEAPAVEQPVDANKKKEASGNGR